MYSWSLDLVHFTKIPVLARHILSIHVGVLLILTSRFFFKIRDCVTEEEILNFPGN